MSTKSTIQNLINTNLANGSTITAVEHRAVENILLNELFQTQYRELYEQVITPDLTITDNATTNLFYDISFIKRGNTVFVNGYIRNKTGSIFSGKILDILNSEFSPKTSNTYFVNLSNNSVVTIENDNFAIDSIGNNTQSFFSGHYQVND
jgi:hypothetical protein